MRGAQLLSYRIPPPLSDDRAAGLRTEHLRTDRGRAGSRGLRAPPRAEARASCRGDQDFFDIQGAWDVFRQSKRIYTRLDAPESVNLVETDEKHGFSIRLREGATRWLRRWLLGVDAPVREKAVKLPEEKSLYCTPEGQVLRVAGAQLFDLLGEQEARYQPRQPQPATIRTAAGIRSLAALPPALPEKRESVTWQGRAGESVILNYEAGLWLAALHFPRRARPKQSSICRMAERKPPSKTGVLRKCSAAEPRVLALDLPGLGEMHAAPPTRTAAALGAIETKQAQKALLVARNLVTLRAEAILVAVRFLGARGGVHLVCGKEAAIAALHAAVLEPELFASLELPLPPAAWAEFMRAAPLALAAGDVVPGALKTYDLSDLIRMIHRKNSPGDAVT